MSPCFFLYSCLTPFDDWGGARIRLSDFRSFLVCDLKKKGPTIFSFVSIDPLDGAIGKT